MDWLSSDFAFLVASARRAIDQHRASLGQPSGSPGAQRGSALRERIHRDLLHHEHELERRERHFALAETEMVRGTMTEMARDINGRLTQLEIAVSWALAAARPDVRLAPILFGEEAGRALLKADCEVVVVAGTDSDYATPVPTALWASEVADSERAPVVVFIPPTELRSTLLLPLIVHEIGHTAVANHGLLVQVKNLYGEAWHLASEEAAGPLSVEEGLGRKAALFHAERRLERWTCELLCDALALAYCGPCYLSAFAAVVLRREVGGTGEAHPPAADRVAAMLLLLDRLGWSDPDADGQGRTAEWLERLAHVKLDDLSDFDERLLREMRPLAQRVGDVVVDCLGDAALAPDGLPHLEEVTELLRLGILPVQLANGAVADRRTILHAAWQRVFEEGWIGDTPESIPMALGDRRFQELLERAMELSFVVENWGLSRGSPHDVALS